MFCTECGVEVTKGSLFCQSCGRKVGGTSEDLDLGTRIDAYLATPLGSDWQKASEGLLPHGASVVLPLLRRTASAIRSYGTNAPREIVMRPIDYAVRMLSALGKSANAPLLEGLDDRSASVRALSGFMLSIPMIEQAGDIPTLLRVLYDDEAPIAKLGAASALLTSPFLDIENRRKIIEMLKPWADQEFPGWDAGGGPTAQSLGRTTLELMLNLLRAAT